MKGLVGQTFSFLTGATTDDALLNRYVEDPGCLVPGPTPGNSQSETLSELPEGNLGQCIGTRMFSPAGLAVSAYFLWRFFRVPPHMLWQTLIGSNILERYSLYTPSMDKAPDSLFSFDKQTLEQNVLRLNPGLSEEQAVMHLVASGLGRARRPFSVCNMAMFLNQDRSGFDYLAQVQSTPFVTGILGMPNGTDANGRRVGGGAITSFGFASEPAGTDQGLVKFEQDRQWALTDSIGTSSAFFAETLQNQFRKWSQDVDGFFAGIDEVADELEDWLRKLLADLGLLGRFLAPLVDGIAEATRGAGAGRSARLARVFDAIGGGREELAAGFRELSVQRLIPRYGSWSVADASPVDGFQTTHFADGGNLENTGICGASVYGDIDNLIAFVNTSTSLSAGSPGVFDAQGNELAGTRVMVGSQIPPLFGYQPWAEGKGYRLYAGDQTPSNPDSYKGFPHFSTFDTRLDPTEINLLASLSAWVVAADENAALFRDMFQDARARR